MNRPEAVGAFIEEVGHDRVASVTACIRQGDEWYIIWKEAAVEGASYAVHVFDFPNNIRILRSGDYRMTQIQALRRVIELMEGVTI